jgi:protein-disulfide isomerase
MLYVLASLVFAIPKRYPGFVWGNEDSQIGIEVFCDPLCPDCRATWPVAQTAISKYPNSVNLRYLAVNLPYHTWSFYSVRAIYALNSTDLAKQTIDAFYLDGDQDKFSNSALQDVAEANIPNQFATYFQAKFKIDPAVFLARFSDPAIASAASGTYGWASQHAVDGTPTIFVNGAITDLGPDSTLNDWSAIIDPLLK